MPPASDTPAIHTAIPPRFQQQRDRVLRILARWQTSLALPRPVHAGSR